MIKRFGILCAIYASVIHQGHAQANEDSITPVVSTTDIAEKDLELFLRKAEHTKIIALSEATHGKNEPLNFRNTLIKALVKRRLIDVVALESGTIEGRLLYDYVLNSTDTNDINQVLKAGLSWQFYVIPQNKELVEWMRNYNADLKNKHKVKLYGFDIPGSPGNPNVKRKMSTAFEYALNYLRSIDPSSHGSFGKRIAPFLPFLHIDFDNLSTKDPQFSHLPEIERAKLWEVCGELIRHFQTHQLDYTRASSKEDFEWAYLAAVNAQQIINWLSYIPYGYVPPSENRVLVNSDIFHLIFNYRDRAMFDNINWIANRESSRIFVFASTNHLLKTPIILTDPKSTVGQRKVLGNYLHMKYGQGYFLISNVVANIKHGASSIENKLLNQQYDHYYSSASYFQSDSDDWQNYYYQSADTKVNLFESTDIVLFDKQQTNIKFLD